jgi:hypothetical protein
MAATAQKDCALMPTKNMTSLNNFRHRVVLARGQTDTVDVDDPTSANIVLTRTAVQRVYASITPTKGQFFLNGFALEENRNAASHYICIRYNSSIDITGFAWLYEERPSGRRWYKVLSVQEQSERERFWQIQVRLQQKSDLATEPAAPALMKNDYLDLPDGVKL